MTTYQLGKEKTDRTYQTIEEVRKAAVEVWKYRHGIHEMGGPAISIYEGPHEIGQVDYKDNYKEPVSDVEGKIIVGYSWSDKNGSWQLNEDGSLGAEIKAVDTAGCRVRKLTPKECLRLMGYNDEEIARIQEAKDEKGKPRYSNSAQYKFAGNSVVVDCFAAILGEIVKDMDGKTPQKSMDEWTE